jgi:hypothetical protein
VGMPGEVKGEETPGEKMPGVAMAEFGEPG